MTDAVAPTTSTQTPARSTFVTVLAWLLIIGMGYCTFISLMQAAAFTFMFPEAGFWSNPRPVRGLDQLPPLAQFMLSNVTIFFVVGWVIFAASLVASIALLRRKNWARVYFVVLFSAGILLQILVMWTQLEIVSSFSISDMPTHPGAAIGSVLAVAKAGSVIFAVATAAVLGWLVKRLLSSAVREEFNAL